MSELSEKTRLTHSAYGHLKLAILPTWPLNNMLDVGLASGVAGVVRPGWKEDGPYTLRPNVDATSSLSHTPLTLSANNITGGLFSDEFSPEYYIGVKSIKVNGQHAKCNESLFSFNIDGEGGTTISTASRSWKL
ncbi:xyloglucanase inhibitor 3 [Artemisia annua]|uniref:Xyloglucanase inhibitor 3 n=1 Tax=Artemisia annua TaxID=35608 RepID=A0A2U1ML47_ARTAN|nr:xyloglucanase inhibitor 3 [Artemisia annua]